jgi:hypothetical protein
MKRLFLAVLVLTIAGMALYAEGTPESARPVDAKPVTVTGKLTIADNAWPTITSGATTYTLMYPRYAAVDIPVKNGDTIAVTGYVVPGPRWGDRKATYLAVTRAEIAGKTYVVAGGGVGRRGGFGADDDYCGPDGGRGSMMGGGRGSMMGRGRR